MKRILTMTITAVLLTAPFAFAQQQQDQPPPCTDEAYRQFDFWVGEWTVTGLQGNLAGENSIRKILDDCVLEESWTGVSGTRGHSFNIWDAREKKWHQTWVDSSGTLLELDGDLVDGNMVLSGTRHTPDGNLATHRITWTPHEDESVRQHWEVSTDGGDNWRTLFDGRYERK